MWLSDLISFLEEKDLERVVPKGFCNPHSYRGYYDQLAFEPKDNVKISEMLADSRKALNYTYEGWKGGMYTMHDTTDVWLAEEGETGDALSGLLLEYMFGEKE